VRKDQAALIAEMESAFGLETLKPDRQLLSFREFVERVRPQYQWYRHCEVLAQVLQRVADGDLKRVMVFMPPRHGKSELATKLFPAYFLYCNPQKWVGISSYAADLSYTFSRRNREHYQDTGGLLRGDAAAVKHWETIEGGGLWAAGVGGPITGKGYSLGVIDDPLKNHEEAFSDRIREKQQEWYGSTFYTRAEADAAIVLIMTRWHEADLAGYLLNEETTDEEPERWHIVNFEALKEEHPREFPPTCTIEPDWRQPGEPLCPERFTLKRLLTICRRVGSYFWNALYQQRPTAADGDVFKQDWFRFYVQLPELEYLVLSVDANFGSQQGSFVVIQLWGIAYPNFYLVDQVRDRFSFTETVEAIRELIERWRPNYGEAAAKLIEKKANGAAVLDELSREFPGLIGIEPQGSKEARAQAASPYVEGGNIWLPKNAAWKKDFMAEMMAFPKGANDDQVDALTQFINWIAQGYGNFAPDDFQTLGNRSSQGASWR
jgi:predicted phage terminase large subunit-like protein